MHLIKTHVIIFKVKKLAGSKCVHAEVGSSDHKRSAVIYSVWN